MNNLDNVLDICSEIRDEFMSKMDGEIPAHLSTIVAIGSIQSMLSKATKNALFDATTQVFVCVRGRPKSPVSLFWVAEQS